MVDLDTSTPQLKVLKKYLDAYTSLDLNNVRPLISKYYQYEPLPESPDIAKQGKERHIQEWKEIFSFLNKFEVRIPQQRTTFKLRLISTTPR